MPTVLDIEAMTDGAPYGRAAEQAILDSIKLVSGFHPPIQQRTFKQTLDILTSTINLLKKKSYSNMSMQEIAQASHCAVPAIYARFEDKSVLLSAVHMLLLQAERLVMDEKLTIENFRGQSVEFFVQKVVSIISNFHELNANFIRAAVVGEVREIHARTDAIMGDFSRRLINVTSVLAANEYNLSKIRIEFALRVMISMYASTNVS